MNELNIKIDLEQITKGILEKETYVGDQGNIYNTIQEKAKQEIKNWIQVAIVSEIKKVINLDDFIDKSYSKVYIREEAKKIINDELRSIIIEYTKSWVNNNMRWIVEKQAEKQIEEFLLPRLQKTISALMVINTESAEQEIQALKEDYENQLEDLEKQLNEATKS